MIAKFLRGVSKFRAILARTAHELRITAIVEVMKAHPDAWRNGVSIDMIVVKYGYKDYLLEGDTFRDLSARYTTVLQWLHSQPESDERCLQ